MKIDYFQRIKKIQQDLTKWNIEAILVDDSINLFYLTGLDLSTGFLTVSKDSAALFVDSRYIEVSISNAPCETRLVNGNFYDSLSSYLIEKLDQNEHRIGFDGSEVVYRKYSELLSRLPKNFQLIALNQPLKELRQKKDDYEIESLKKAAKLCAEGFNYILSLLKDEIEEKEISSELRKYWLTHGAEKEGFEPIIAFGEKSSMPHYRAADRKLKKNQIVLIDIGVVVNHYHSDMTRTLFYGKPDEKFLEIYGIVKEAQVKAVDALKPGMYAKEIDQVAREWIAKKGYGSFFTHGLGHGVGLDIHELPVLKSTPPFGDVKLEEGMVVTIEPGIYLPHWGGVRIEDTVLITKNSYEILTTTPKELIIV